MGEKRTLQPSLDPHGSIANRLTVPQIRTKTVPSQEVPKELVKENGKFNYESFYAHEIQKKQDDKSYRVFNNINRLAGEFPKAHTVDANLEAFDRGRAAAQA